MEKLLNPKQVKSKSFNYDKDFSQINFRNYPELYQVGKGEQGVLLCEPYKGEILPYWRFRTPEIARESAEKIYSMFEKYLEDNDFVGADMARKFLQMGYTRARRYANHKTGRKYNQMTRELKPLEVDEVKAASAREFYPYWYKARLNPTYVKLMKEHKQKYGS